jgi:hypothetical protein
LALSGSQSSSCSQYSQETCRCIPKKLDRTGGPAQVI